MKYCYTEKMLADYFTKPLQGAIFGKFGMVIQGIPLGNPDTDLG